MLALKKFQKLPEKTTVECQIFSWHLKICRRLEIDVTINELNLNAMSRINKVILVGHLGKDPDLRYLEGNISVARFPLTTVHTYTKKGLKE